MKYCWSHQDNSGNLLAPGVVLLGVLCLSSMIQEINVASNPAGHAVIILIVFIFLFAVPAFCAFVSARRYHVDAEGMTVAYPFGVKMRYRWCEFSEVAICKIHYATKGNAHTVAIRCVVGEEDFGPKQAKMGKEAWSTMWYEFLHFQKIVSIYYTKERYAEFLEMYPGAIKDYRYLGDYLH